MKTKAILLGLFWPVAMSTGVSGQSSFNLANYAYGANFEVVVNAPVMNWTGALLEGAGWRAELYGGSTSDSLSPVVGVYTGTREIVPFYRPGYFRSTHDVAVRVVPPGGWAWLQVRVWTVDFGATYDEAAARGLGGYGASALFYARGGDPTGSIPTVPGPLIGLQSFSVLPIVPEPSTWLLLVVGLGGLFWDLRRNRPSIS